MIKYVNIENGELLTTEQLKQFFNDVVVNEESTTYDSFDYWLECCQTKNNGSLEEVEKVTEWDIRHMLHDEYITQATADYIAKLELYKTKDNSFYTPDGAYAYDVFDLNSFLE